MSFLSHYAGDHNEPLARIINALVDYGGDFAVSVKQPPSVEVLSTMFIAEAQSHQGMEGCVITDYIRNIATAIYMVCSIALTAWAGTDFKHMPLPAETLQETASWYFSNWASTYKTNIANAMGVAIKTAFP